MPYHEEFILASRRHAGPNPSHRVLSVQSYLGCDYCNTESTRRRAERVRHPYCHLCILEVRGYQAMVQRKQASEIDRTLLMRFALDEAVFALYNSNGHTNRLAAGTYPDGFAATIEHDVIRATYVDNPNVATALIDFTQDDVLRTQLTQQFCIHPLPSYFIVCNVFHYLARYHYSDYRTCDTRTLSVDGWKPILKALFCKYFDLRRPWRLMQLSAPDDTPNTYHGTKLTDGRRAFFSLVDASPRGGLHNVVIRANRGRNATQETEWEECERYARY